MAPLAEPVDAGRDDWYRTMPGWHLAYAVLAVLTGALVTADEAGWWPVVLLVLLACWYGGTGARALHREPGRLGVGYLAGAVPLSLLLFWVEPIGALMLFMLYPHIWALLPARQAIVVTGAGVVGTAVLMLARTGPDAHAPASVVLMVVVTLVTALVLGLWITRIIEQSRRRADLIDQLARTRAELAAVSKEAGALAERERLAKEIHDTLAQGFASMLLLIEAAKADTCTDDVEAHRCLDQARRTAGENLAEARALVAAEPPPRLRDASLPSALDELVERFGSETGLAASLAVMGRPRRLTPNQDVVLLRVTQESLANIRRHAGAREVAIELRYQPASVTLRIADDGCGFDPAAATGFGIAGMRDRAAEVGAVLTVSARNPSGTLVELELS